MLTSHSPSSSPQAFRARSYQNTCRSSSQVRSPRLFHQNSPSSRRQGQDASPVLSSGPVAASPPVVRTTRDAATQYSPPEQVGAAEVASASSSRTDIPRAPDPESPTKRKRGEGVPATPPTPKVRVDPRPEDGPPGKAQDGSAQEAPPAAAPAEGSERTPKRTMSSEQQVKVMPLQYEKCEPKDLGVLISGLLIELVSINDKRPLRDGQLTRFHSRAPPTISIQDYLNRLIVHATLSPPILLSMVLYIDKLCSLYPTFTISSLTVHRFLITSATVASKGLSDSFWTNNAYATVGGVSKKELAILELDFLMKVNWEIVPDPEVLVDYYKNLVARGKDQGYVLEGDEAADEELVDVDDETDDEERSS